MSLAVAIADGLAAMAIDLPAAARARLEQHLQLISKWNRVHNLTAVRETEQMVILHLLDSLSVLPHLEGARTVLDVGTGPGLPGIPIAIALPGSHVTLLDSSHKKCAFLQQAKTELGLANVEVVCDRVENWMPREKFEAVVSRAFSDLGDFVAQAQHLAGEARHDVGGRHVAGVELVRLVVPAQAEVQGQMAGYLPIVLKVKRVAPPSGEPGAERLGEIGPDHTAQ
jgi:16S rRNA (guanine527-N7)-methyltransferase